jgi:hypothetical protein
VSGTTVTEAFVRAAIDKAVQDVRPYWRTYGPPIDVTFPAANMKRDIEHRLGTTPTGYQILDADGLLYREPGSIWTHDLAWMRATTANVHARIIFFTLLGDADEK